MGNNTLMGLLKDRQIAQSPISRKIIGSYPFEKKSLKVIKGSSEALFINLQ